MVFVPIGTKNIMNNQKSHKRIFIPGDEWVYYKLYCGPKMADNILSDIIKPVCGKLLSIDVIDKWFYIRYADPEPHLRVRFHFVKNSSFNKIDSEFNRLLEPFLEKNLVWKLQIDTYQREIERYGDATMEAVEDLFCFDSEMILNMLHLFFGDEREPIRWLVALKSVDSFLDDFGLDIKAKFDILFNLKESFSKELGMTRNLKRQMDLKYRKEFKAIKDAMEGEGSYIKPSMLSLLKQRSDSNKALVKNILEYYKRGDPNPDFTSLLSSIIHMSMNRIFISRQRKHELVIYDFLSRYYKSVIARRKYN